MGRLDSSTSSNPTAHSFASIDRLDDNQSIIPWTSSRCRRLLRPLQTRIIALRKAIAAERIGVHNGPQLSNDLEILGQLPSKQTRFREGREKKESTRRPPRRTYSRKGSPNLHDQSSKAASRLPRQQPQATPLHVPNVPTPVLRRVKDPEAFRASSESAAAEGTLDLCVPQKSAKCTRLAKALGKLERTQCASQPSLYQLYRGLLHDLDTLLYVTSPRKPSAGRKSLLSMCLRKVPCYAAEVEAWEQLRNANQGPISSIQRSSYTLRVYEDLEALVGTSAGRNHLRNLLRAHAIYLVQELIAEGLLHADFVYVLIDHCRFVNCAHESADLMQALLNHSYQAQSGGGDKLASRANRNPLPRLSGIAEDTIFTSHLLAATTSLLLDTRLPAEALSTSALGFLWTKSASSMLDHVASPCAIRFAATGLGLLSYCLAAEGGGSKAYGGMKNASVQPALNSVLGAMSAMAMIAQDFGSITATVETKSSGQIQRLISQIFQEALTLTLSKGGTQQATYPLLLALFLSSCGPETNGAKAQVKTTLRTLWGAESRPCRKAVRATRECQLYDATVNLACSIAHSCSKGTTRPSSIYFAHISECIDGLQIPRLASLRSDGAFLLAHKTDDLRDLIFAETLVGASTTQRPATGEMEAKPLFDGYRWEEGISEWIAVSPAAKHGSHRNIDGREYAPKDPAELNPSLATTTAPTGAETNRGNGSGEQLLSQYPLKRKRPQDKHDECMIKKPNKPSTGDNELGTRMSQENRPRNPGKGRLGNVRVETKGGNWRAVRSGQAGRRKALQQLTITGNLTGHGDDDELGV
ncbi:hypothetical protein CSOJ01_10054 [Colletotrichum sojae]|uniref:Uncharacterized protein n=1 Tax=Colletotrichum sojae TaxID=2175907 RepID=A0A8H6J187_9PEZI|nr:hypothetical protein CSOJ01_10054 [Colletotrichum sojae]